MFVVMDNDTVVKLVKAFGAAIAQLIEDVYDIKYLLIALLFTFVQLFVWLPDLIFKGMKKFDRWKKAEDKFDRWKKGEDSYGAHEE
jgi:hypothetical protein